MQKKLLRTDRDLNRVTLHRIHRIFERIRSGDFPNRATLAKEIQISKKTIYRDIEFMKDFMNLPIEFNAHRHGYEFSTPVSNFPLLKLTEGELFAIFVGENEQEFLQLKNLQWTEAQRTDVRNYQPGLIIQFHQNVPNFRRGDRVTVKGKNEAGDVLVERKDGEVALLPVDQVARFQVYESKKIALASGDMIRITQNGFTKDNQRLNNGDLREIKGFTKAGDIKLSNGWIFAGDYGNVTHGYCVTSYSSQSKSVDRVFVAEGSESFRAADRQQFYVSASRFKEALTIYTDDKRQLLEAVSKSSERPSATDLAGRQQTATSQRAVINHTDGMQAPDGSGTDGKKQRQAQAVELTRTHKQHLTRARVEKARYKGMTV